jgi:hypothetical protein
MEVTINTVKIDKTAFRVFSSFAEADADEKHEYLSQTPAERLLALELMRQSVYGYDDPATPRLQRVFEIAQRA